MSNYKLDWVAGGGDNSTGQKVQYKKASDAVWIDAAIVSATTTTYTIENLDANTIYDFRVITLCSDGGPSGGQSTTTITLNCPVVNYTLTPTSIGYSFQHLGGNVTKYAVSLINDSDETVIKTFEYTNPNGVISGNFIDLTPSTNYQISITVYAGDTFGFSKTCPPSAQTTSAPATCAYPTNLNVTIE